MDFNMYEIKLNNLVLPSTLKLHETMKSKLLHYKDSSPLGERMGEGMKQATHEKKLVTLLNT